MMLPLLIGAGLLLLAGSKKKKAAETDPHLESQMIGTELLPLPAESRTAIMRLLLTNDPANDAGVYAGAIAQLTQLATLPFTVNALTRIAKERFG